MREQPHDARREPPSRAAIAALLSAAPSAAYSLCPGPSLHDPSGLPHIRSLRNLFHRFGKVGVDRRGQHVGVRTRPRTARCVRPCRAFGRRLASSLRLLLLAALSPRLGAALGRLSSWLPLLGYVLFRSDQRRAENTEVRGALADLTRCLPHIHVTPSQASTPKSLGGSPTCCSPGEQPPLLHRVTGSTGAASGAVTLAPPPLPAGVPCRGYATHRFLLCQRWSDGDCLTVEQAGRRLCRRTR